MKIKSMPVHQIEAWDITKIACETHGFCGMQLEISTCVSMYLAETLKPKTPLSLWQLLFWTPWDVATQALVHASVFILANISSEKNIWSKLTRSSPCFQ